MRSETIEPARPLGPESAGEHHDDYAKLMARCRDLPPVATAVVHPCEQSALEGPLLAAKEGLITPILIGPMAKIRRVAEESGLDLADHQLIDAPHSHAAAAQAVEIAGRGEVQAIMKGSLHTDELMHAVVSKTGGLRTERRISHVFVMDVPSYPKPLLITDAAINIHPDLMVKRDICQNAIDLAHALDNPNPKVAILSAVETINPQIPSTLDAAALCKMAERGQISGGVLDGPLAMDNAISLDAARIKGLHSEVAGQADILIAPDLESGNMLAKQLSFLAHAEAAGLVLGARLPVILTSRADNVRARMASCAIAALYVDHRAMPIKH
ncbi:MAG: bifunctional enoyl-CoA hydratase/phosphate acetyltransferase [Candidatus Competibacterales bacterium]